MAEPSVATIHEEGDESGTDGTVLAWQRASEGSQVTGVCPGPVVDLTVRAGMGEVWLSWQAPDAAPMTLRAAGLSEGAGNPTPEPDPTAAPSPSPVASDDSAVTDDSRDEPVRAVESGPDVSGYVVTVSPGDRIIDVDELSVVVSGLRNGVEHSFTVFAVNSHGRGPGQTVTATPVTGMEGEVAGVLVKFTDPVSWTGSVPGSDRVEVVDLEIDRQVADQVHLVEFSDAVDEMTAEQIADELEADPRVEWAEPDQFVFIAQAESDSRAPPDDPLFANEQWNLWSEFGVGLAEGPESLNPAWSPDLGAGVTVAVIDTGITAHPDLEGQTVAGYDFVSSPAELAAPREPNGPDVDFDADGQPGWDADPTDPGDWRNVEPLRKSTWHGTHIAGIIAAKAGNGEGITGLAPGARIQPVRAISWRGGLLSDITAAITWASGGSIPGVPANTTPSKVLNLSFTLQSPCTPALQAAITGANERGSVVIAAAGNANDDVAKYAPANCEGTIAVAATGKDGQRAPFSNYGSGIDIAAPGGSLATGSGVVSTMNSGYAVKEGTSIAAAHVTAMTARILGTSPDLTHAQVRTRVGARDAIRPFRNGVCDKDPNKTCGEGIAGFAQVMTTPACGPLEEGWHEISTSDQLASVGTGGSGAGSCGWGAQYRLINDINVAQAWTPAGTISFNSFTGVLDGGGHAISGLQRTTEVGTYAVTRLVRVGRTVTLTVGPHRLITSANVAVSGIDDGTLSGFDGTFRITDMTATTFSYTSPVDKSVATTSVLGQASGAVSASAFGLFGSAAGARIRDLELVDVDFGFTNASNFGRFGQGVGAVVGRATDVELTDIRVSGSLTGEQGVGGILGISRGTSSCVRCFADVSVVGGSSLKRSAGGLVGLNEGTLLIEFSSTRGTVNAPNGGAGGLVGNSSRAVTVRDSDSSVDVSGGGGYAGGLIGAATGTSAALDRVLARGSVSGFGTPSTGLIGILTGATLSVSESFWDSEVTGQSSSAGGQGWGESSATLKSPLTFNPGAGARASSWALVSGWQAPSSEKVWGICSSVNGGYPFQLWQYAVPPAGCDVGLMPSPGSPTRTASGFALPVTNFNASFTWNVSSTAGTASISASGIVMVSGLSPDESATVTITTSRTGYGPGWVTVTAQAASTGLTPALGPVSRASGGFSFPVTNVDPAYAWSVVSSAGSAVIDSSGVVTVSGLSSGESATVTVTTTRVGYAEGSSSLSSAALPAPDPQPSSSGGGPAGGSPQAREDRPPRAEPELSVVQPGSTVIRLLDSTGAVVRGDLPVAVVPLPRRDGKVIRAPGWDVELQGVEESGTPAPLNAAGNLEVVQGRGLATSGRGFAPDSQVGLYLFSELRTLGTLTTNSRGSFSGVVPVPADVPVGVHTAQVTGYTPSGDILIVSLGIEVAAPAVDPLLNLIPSRVEPLRWLPVTSAAGEVQVLAGSSGCSAVDGDGSGARGRSLVFWNIGTCVFEVRSGGNTWKRYRVPIVPSAAESAGVQELRTRKVWFDVNGQMGEKSVAMLAKVAPRMRTAAVSYAYWIDSIDTIIQSRTIRQHAELARRLRTLGPVTGMRTVTPKMPWRETFDPYATRYILIAWRP